MSPVCGGTLQTAKDVSRLLGVPHSAMIHCLYKAPNSFRYHAFEIPKRTGGMRLISAPRGLLRQMQASLLPMLQQVYRAHPSAHGFIHERSVVSNAREH